MIDRETRALATQDAAVSLPTRLGWAALAAGFAFVLCYHGAGSNLPIAVYAFGCVLVAIALQYGAVYRAGPYVLPLTLWMVGYLGFLILGIPLSSLPENSFFIVWSLAMLPLAYLFASQLEPSSWRECWLALQVVGVVSAVAGIAEFVVGDRRANGFLYDPNLWCAVQNLLFFGVMAQYVGGQTTAVRRWRGRVDELSLFALAMAGACTYSRAGLAAFVLILLLCFITMVLARVRWALVTRVAVIVLLGHGVVGLMQAPRYVPSEEGYTVDPGDRAWQLRFAQWRAAWQIYRNEPWTGTGFGTFKVRYPLYRTEDDLTTLGNYAHNDYLQFLQEGGPVQLGLLLLLMAYLARRFVGSCLVLYRKTGPPGDYELPGLILAMGVVFAHAALTFLLYQPQILLVMGVMLARVTALAETSRRAPRLASPLAAGGLGILLTAAWLTLALDGVTAAVVNGHRGVPFAGAVREQPGRLHDTLEMLAVLRPGNSANHFALATLYRKVMEEQADPAARRSLAIAAAGRYKAGLAANPWNTIFYIHYAGLLEDEPGVGESGIEARAPVDLIREAIRLGPIYLEPYIALARWQESAGDRQAALDTLYRRGRPWFGLLHGDYRTSQWRFLVYLYQLASEAGHEEAADFAVKEMARLVRG